MSEQVAESWLVGGRWRSRMTDKKGNDALWPMSYLILLFTVIREFIRYPFSDHI